ncbi:MAG: hypothetical protein OSJ38_01125 [Lachnospiraceae bacterium]|jgi:hypothetical protein|nr:hypothetical protein [Lachnospiraceae bacterium]
MGAKKIKLFSFSILILFCCLLSGTACGKEKENNEESVPDYEYEYTSKTVRIEEAEAIFMASLQGSRFYKKSLTQKNNCVILRKL